MANRGISMPSRTARDFEGDPRTPPSVKELALAVGLTEDSTGCRFIAPRDENEAGHVLLECLTYIDMVEEDLLFSPFCVRYLPDLVKIFLRPNFRFPLPTERADRLTGCDCYLIFRMSSNRYFIKYFLSSHHLARPAGEITRCLVERFQAELPMYLSGMLHDPKEEGSPIGQHIAFLCSTLSGFLTLHFWQPYAVPLPRETSAKLVASLDRYLRIDPRADRAQVLQVQRGLRRDPVWFKDVGLNFDVARNMYKCCEHDCLVDDEGKLYLCARCQTAIYCGRAHQHADWVADRNPHKDVCLPTPW